MDITLHIQSADNEFILAIPELEVHRTLGLRDAFVANTDVFRLRERFPMPGEQQARAMGSKLAGLLFGEHRSDIEAQVVAEAGEVTRVVLVLEGDAWNLPLEFLAVEQRQGTDITRRFWVERQCRFVRHIPCLDAKPAPLLAPGTGWTALLARSSSYDLEVPEHHLARLQKAIGDAGLLQHAFWTASRSDLETHLKAHAVFHFLGHGAPDHLLLGDEDAEPDRVDADELCRWLTLPSNSGSSPSLVVLGACDSATGTAGSLGLARTIVRRTGLPVVAMQGKVGQQASTAFLAKFYEHLQVSSQDRVTYDIEHAVDIARRTMEPAQLGIPVLVADVLGVVDDIDVVDVAPSSRPTPTNIDAGSSPRRRAANAMAAVATTVWCASVLATHLWLPVTDDPYGSDVLVVDIRSELECAGARTQGLAKSPPNADAVRDLVACVAAAEPASIVLDLQLSDSTDAQAKAVWAAAGDVPLTIAYDPNHPERQKLLGYDRDRAGHASLASACAGHPWSASLVLYGALCKMGLLDRGDDGAAEPIAAVAVGGLAPVFMAASSSRPLGATWAELPWSAQRWYNTHHLGTVPVANLEAQAQRLRGRQVVVGGAPPDAVPRDLKVPVGRDTSAHQTGAHVQGLLISLARSRRLLWHSPWVNLAHGLVLVAAAAASRWRRDVLYLSAGLVLTLLGALCLWLTLRISVPTWPIAAFWLWRFVGSRVGGHP